MKLYSLPNLLTLINLLAGCVAVVLVFSPSGLQYVPYCTLVSLVADYFDGMAARFTKTHSDLGRELDSLADVVSFGFVPGAIIYTLLSFHLRAISTVENDWGVILYSAPAFLVTLFSALRLAKFNLDTRQSEGFIGLATPACTIFVIGLLLIFLHNDYQLATLIINPWFLFALIALLSYLLVAEIPMFSFKFKQFAWAGNELRYSYIAAVVALLGVFHLAGIALAVILYVAMSVAIFARNSARG